MAKAEDKRVSAQVRSVYPPILLLIVAALLIYLAHGYGDTASQLPVLVGSGTFVLIILDVVSRLRGRVGDLIGAALGAGFEDREMKHAARWQSELLQIVWVAACVVSILLIGILPTVPIFVLSYMLIQGRQSFFASLAVAIAVVSAVALVFELLLEYKLYRGLLFD